MEETLEILIKGEYFTKFNSTSNGTEVRYVGMTDDFRCIFWKVKILKFF